MTKLLEQLLTEQQETDFRSAAERKPEASQPRARLALHCWRKGELAEALDWADRCLELDSLNIDFYRLKANILADMQQTAKAVEIAMRARLAVPQSIPAHILTVRMLLLDLQPAKAQQALDAALLLAPDSQQLEHLKSLQLQILAASRQANHDPLKWLTRKFNNRRANVAGEDSADS